MNSPNLRFKDFNDEWKVMVLSELMSFNNGINAEKSSYGHGRKFINVLDILNNNSIKYNDIIGSVAVSEKVEQTNKVEYGDLLFLRSSETREDVGKSSVYLDEDNFALFGGFVIRGKKQADYHPYFLKLNLESPNVRNQIGSKSGGSTRFNVSQSILNSIEINIPTKKEQEKIADFISHFGKKIQLQQEKIDLLKEQKKGFLQKMFPQPNEKQPQMRFNGFTGDWKSCKLGDIVDFYSGLTYSPDDVLNNEGTLVLRSSNIKSGNVVNADNVYVDSNKVNSEKIIKNDIIVVVRNGSRNLIGKHAIVKNEMPNTVIGAFMTGIRAQSPNFINAMLDTNQFDIEISKNLGATINQITTGAFKSMLFSLPQKEEQDKIGQFFRKLDDSIEIQNQKLYLLQQQKQAFMQQMFI